ncbi:hypothetical protein G9A89_015625 [Geosiphon pyriformis]|nr:hypothetical protein G9A89_015625 [Geosiphon pyriformis]
MTVIGFSSRIALLNNSMANSSLSSNGKIASSDLFLVMVAGRILLCPNSIVKILMAGSRNWRLVDGLLSMIFSFVVSVLAFEFHFKVSTRVVFDFVGTNKLPETAADKWVGTVVDKLMLETDRLEVSIIAASLGFDTTTASLVGNLVDIELGLIDDLEFESGNWDFDINFPIVGYLNVDSN